MTNSITTFLDDHLYPNQKVRIQKNGFKASLVKNIPKDLIPILLDYLKYVKPELSDFEKKTKCNIIN